MLTAEGCEEAREAMIAATPSALPDVSMMSDNPMLTTSGRIL